MKKGVPLTLVLAIISSHMISSVVKIKAVFRSMHWN